jgi:peptide/nickel transport system ATP-binding protein
MLDLVGMAPEDLDKYPHQFSGGQRQRIAVARALLARPRFLICDEPTSALDVSIQAEILNLLKDLQAKFGLTILFISHNLAVVRQMSDDMVVLRNGRIEEFGRAQNVYQSPKSKYTRELLELTPILPTTWATR